MRCWCSQTSGEVSLAVDQEVGGTARPLRGFVGAIRAMAGMLMVLVESRRTVVRDQRVMEKGPVQCP